MTANMKRWLAGIAVVLGCALLYSPVLTGLTRLAQGQIPGYAVSFTKDNVRAFRGLILGGKHSNVEVLEGQLVFGDTDVGPTVLVVIGEGKWIVREPSAYKWVGIETPIEPFSEPLSNVYLRLHPRFCRQLLADVGASEIQDAGAFEIADSLYALKFRNSYHAGEHAIIPSADVGVIDIESKRWGRLTITEGSSYGDIVMSPEVRRWPPAVN